MYGKSNYMKVLAVGLAAAVILSLPAHKYEGRGEAVKSCLLFPQFAEAASSDREELTDEGDVIYAFRIGEIWDKLVESLAD